MAVTINASTSNGLVQTADTSGSIQLQSNGTTVATAQSTGFQISTYTPETSLITSGTAQATTSGTSIQFTGIPSWVKRITVMFNNVSTSGTSLVQLQLGSGSYTTSGYNGSTGNFTSGTPAATTFSTGFATSSGGSAADARNGAFTLTTLGGNIWVCTGQFSVGAYFTFGTGQVALSGTLDRLQITTVNGTDTFDLGSINILYE